jgi:hypothetical protein
MKCSRANSFINWLKVTDVSGALSLSLHHQDLKMGTKVAPDMLVIFIELICPTAREDFINFSRRESFRS